MTDLVAKLLELCERHAKIPEGPYFVGIDEAADCPPHTNSGLSLVDTGRQSDWPIARLCEGPTAAAIADLPNILAALREAAAEIERLRVENANMAEELRDVLADWNELVNGGGQIAGLRADAERYRWLRDDPSAFGWQRANGITGEKIDVLIDTARASVGKEGK